MPAQKEFSPYFEGFFSVFRPQPRLTVSEWAAKYRILTSHGADESGPWRNERTPYLVEIMDELSSSSLTREVVFCKGSQIGATEAGINWLLYLMDCHPGPIMAAQPDDGEAEDMSINRLGPSLELCDRLAKKMSSPSGRSSGNTILTKKFANGTLYLRGASSSRNLSGKPVGNLYLDEVDRYPKTLPNEGDPVKVALRRITNFQRAKVFYSSTPTTVLDSRIWKLYQDSDRRVFEVPCPECGQYQEIVFERLHWDKGDYDNVYLICAECGACIPEHCKTEMLAKGRWKATNPGHIRAGFHLSALYSPYGWYTWGDTAKQYEVAEGDDDALIVFIQTVLGLPYESKSESLAEGYLAKRVERYLAQVPEGVLLLTLAVDVQKNRLEYEICGWGEGEESWGIEYGVIRGDPQELSSNDPENPSVWEVLTKRFQKRFTHADGNEIHIACMAIDSGGNHTDTVYQYVDGLQKQKKWVLAVKGSSNLDKPLMNPPLRPNKGRPMLLVLGVEHGKTLVHGRLRREKPGPGYCHFPKDESTGYDRAFYAGMTAEKRERRVSKGKVIQKWEKMKGRSNEPFDLRVYGTAAMRFRRPDWQELREMRQARLATGKAKTSLAGKKPKRPRSRPGIKLAAV